MRIPVVVACLALVVGCSSSSSEPSTGANATSGGSGGASPQGGAGGATVGTTEQRVGSPITTSVPWTSGENVRVDIAGGTIRVGDMSTALSVKPGSGSTLDVTFTPFESNDDAAAAVAEITDDLVLVAMPSGGEILVDVSRMGTHQASLSARVDIVLPSGFDAGLAVRTDSGDVHVAGIPHGTNARVESVGSIDVASGGDVLASTDNGDVAIDGATGQVQVSTGLGDVHVSLGAATMLTSGSIATQQGDIVLTAPAASTLSILATSSASGMVVVPQPLPPGWTETSASSTTSAALMGNGGTNVLRVDSSADALPNTVTIELP